MNSEERLAEIRLRLEREFSPESLLVEDQGHLHVGHEGARDGRGHFRVMIVSDSFNGLNMVIYSLQLTQAQKNKNINL